MRGTADYDRNSYPFRYDFPNAVVHTVTDVRTREQVHQGNEMTEAVNVADTKNKEFWAKVDAGTVAVS